MMRGGTVVDATIIAAPSSTKNRDGNPPLEPRGLEVEFFPKEEVLHEKVKIYG
jgi:hypothetical protein